MDPGKVEGASYKFHVAELALAHLEETDQDIEKIDLSSIHVVMNEGNRELDAAINDK